ncbi:hypothetical protein NA57DRAFT_43632 [Rhizodiscina lignyota]|uniref:Uncharacterized protein n=1 Tax=Rhizodiscina lignyota TaxID=1504668 RepID=A0A9P4I8B0_9PEZI|nr:hypothetical protein NA57DRAFT_43632 [Rhizodiscina lignyota]
MTQLVGWVSAPNIRGTISLIHGCLATIIICTWNALHLNIPADKDSVSRKVLRHIQWMVIGILAPELVSMSALRERPPAALMVNPVRSDVSPKSWTLTHAQYVNMGGFSLVFSNDSRYRLNAPQFLALLSNDCIKLPRISERDIQDKSNADSFQKTFACLQIGWFLSYVASRAIQQLPVTTLELFTVGFISCTFFTYGGWWHKPKDVDVPTDIHTHDTFESLQTLLGEHTNRYQEPRIRIGIMDNLGSDRTGMGIFKLVLILPMLTFGASHLLGWNTHFNSKIETILWRTCSIGCLSLPLVIFVVSQLSTVRKMRSASIAVFMPEVLYICLRLYLVVEVFLGLRKVPSAVYDDVHWTQFVPHLGS